VRLLWQKERVAVKVFLDITGRSPQNSWKKGMSLAVKREGRTTYIASFETHVAGGRKKKLLTALMFTWNGYDMKT
jgi:hypothetical protein